MKGNHNGVCVCVWPRLLGCVTLARVDDSATTSPSSILNDNNKQGDSREAVVHHLGYLWHRHYFHQLGVLGVAFDVD